MRVRHHAQGKFYTIECPEGTRIVRRSEQPADGEAVPHDHLVVPLNGKEVRIPADPPELLPLLAESGKFGITLVGEPVPDMRLAGVVCPGCGEIGRELAPGRGRLGDGPLRPMRGRLRLAGADRHPGPDLRPFRPMRLLRPR